MLRFIVTGRDYYLQIVIIIQVLGGDFVVVDVIVVGATVLAVKFDFAAFQFFLIMSKIHF